MLSFAAMTPWILLFVLTSIWSKIVAGVVRIPVGHELLRALLQLACLEERVQDGVVAALEPERVLVGLAAPELGDDAALLVRALRLHPGDDAVGLRLADRRAVERDVDRGGAADDLAVVVDRLAALRREELLDRRGGAVVERRLDDDLRARGEAGLRLGLLLRRVVEGVVDRRRDAGLLANAFLKRGASNCTQRTDDFVSGSRTQTSTFADFFFVLAAAVATTPDAATAATSTSRSDRSAESSSSSFSPSC